MKKTDLQFLEINFNDCDDSIKVEFFRKKHFGILYIEQKDFQAWLDKHDFLNIDYEEYCSTTDNFRSIAYTITKEDFFNDSDYQNYRERLARMYFREVFEGEV